jgi:tRNA A-37 threonylcarbamoyl transferase component Bud32/Flp pilus assembly protein TadD
MASLGHYTLIQEIGGGGMATVYEAQDQRIGRRVALKVLTLPLYLSQAQRQVMIDRLMREARAAGRLSHPNIVTVFDVGEDGGHHFIAMEYLEGQSLRERLGEGPLSLPEAVRILDGVAVGLDHAHAQGVLHRDIKPSNVMLLSDGRVKLADFGVARHADDPRLTQTGIPVGSPAYMAPEQVRGEPVTPASDRWSLGVLLYEMLAGHPPFTGENIPAILHQVAYHPAPRLPHVSRAVQAVLDRALAREPGRRYESAMAMAVDLKFAVGKAAASPAQRPRAVPAPEPALAGAKGGEVAARTLPLPRRIGWAWVLPLAALLALTPLFLNRPTREEAGSPRPAATPTARSGARQPAGDARNRTVAAPHVPRVEVTEITSKPEPEATARSAAAPRPAPQVRAERSPTPVGLPQRSVRRRSQPRSRTTTRLAATPAAQPRSRRAARVAAAPAVPTRSRTAARRAAAPEATPRSRTAARLAAAPTAPTRLRQRAQTTEVAPRRRRTQRVQTAVRAQPQTRRTRLAAADTNATRTRPRTRQNVRSLDARGYRLLRQGRAGAAEPLLREAVRRNPNYAYAQYNLGWSLLEQGKAREAVAPLRRTAAQQPNRWEPHHRLAQAYARMGEHEKARQAAARAQALRRGRRG